MMHFCRLTLKLASARSSRQKADSIFQLDFGLLQKIISVTNDEFMILACDVQQDNPHKRTPLF